jgi:hypothetical protein
LIAAPGSEYSSAMDSTDRRRMMRSSSSVPSHIGCGGAALEEDAPGAVSMNKTRSAPEKSRNAAYRLDGVNRLVAAMATP